MGLTRFSFASCNSPSVPPPPIASPRGRGSHLASTRKARGLLGLVTVLGLTLVACTEDDLPSTPTDPPALTPTSTPAPPTPTATTAPSERGAVQVSLRDTKDRPLQGVVLDFGGGVLRYSDKDGRVALGELPAGEPLPIGFRKEGYAPTYKTITLIPGETSTLRVRLVEEGVFESFQALDGYRFGDYTTGLRILIPPDSLVNGSGNAYKGEALITHTVLNLQGKGVAAVPGDLLGVDPSGDPKPLTAFAAIVFDLQSSGGIPLFLAPGATVSLELPLGDESILAEGASVPGWIYDDSEGAYRASISSVVSQSSLLSDVKTVSLTVNSLAPWVVARPTGGAWLSGTVTAGGGEALVGGEVRVSGGYPALMVKSTIQADGSYCLRVPAGTALAVEAATDVGGVIFTKSSPEAAGLTACAGVGVEPISLSLETGCVGGAVLDGEGRPLAGYGVWSDAGTQGETDSAGAFCVLGPADRAVSVHAEDYASRSTRPSVAASCPLDGSAGACASQLTFQPALAQYLYRINTLSVAEPGEGIDLTGDGEPNNALGVVFSGLSASALAQVQAFLQQLVREGTITPEQADQWYATAEEFFEGFDDTLASPVQYLTDRGSIIWLLQATVIESGATLEVLQGEYDGQSFSPGAVIANMSGTEAEGFIDVGPSDLSFDLPPEDLFVPTDATSTLRIFGARSQGVLGVDGLDEGLLAGLIPTADIIAAANTFIPESIEPEGAEVGIPIPKEDIIATIQASLDAHKDATVQGQDAISFAMDMEGISLRPVGCEAGYWVNHLEIAAEGDGPDLDGDGDGDSDMEALLQTVAVATEQGFYDQLVANGVPPRLAESTAEALGESLVAMLGLDNANGKLGDTLDNEAVVPLFLLAESEPVILEAWAGKFAGDGYGKGNFKWSLPGAVTAGVLSVEAEVLERSFDVTTPLGGEAIIGTVTFHKPRISANITRQGMEEGRQVFVISVAEILRLTELVLDTLSSAGSIPDELGAPFVAYFEEALLESAGLDLGPGVGPAYALSYLYDARVACLAPLEESPAQTPTPVP